MTGWVRLWHDMPTDPKWRVIAKRAGQSIAEVMAVFNFVMVNASGNAMKRGETHNLFHDDIAAALDMEPEQIEAILSAMQGKVLDGDRVTGWEKRQPKREDSSTERVREYRKRNETQCNALKRPDTDTDTDTEKKERKRSAGAPTDYAFVGKVVRLKTGQLETWRQSYHAIPDMLATLRAADDYYSDHPPKDGWFYPVSQWLKKDHERALTAKRTPLDVAEEKALRGAL